MGRVCTSCPWAGGSAACALVAEALTAAGAASPTATDADEDHMFHHDGALEGTAGALKEPVPAPAAGENWCTIFAEGPVACAVDIGDCADVCVCVVFTVTTPPLLIPSMACGGGDDAMLAAEYVLAAPVLIWPAEAPAAAEAPKAFAAGGRRNE